MTSPGTGIVRLVRAAVLGTLVVLLTVSAHGVGGGGMPGPFGWAMLATIIWPLALLATRRRLRPALLVAGLGTGQLVGHAVLGWLAGTGASASVSVECLQHAAHRTAPTGCVGETVAATAHAHGAATTGLLMVLAHGAATVLAALLVARGERVLWHVLELVVRALPVLLAQVQVRSVLGPAPLLVPTRADLDVRAGRGPPAYAA